MKKRETNKSKVYIVKSFDDVNDICRAIKERYIVIVNVNAASHKTRYIEFISAFIFALGGKRTKLEDNIFSFQIV